MEYVLLGNSGLRVSELCLGTMTFGEEWGWGAPKAECLRMLETFIAEGGNFLDTACNYNGGSSESFLGEFLEGRRGSFVLGTKYTLTRDGRDPNAGGNHRKNMIASLESSLRRLRTDYVDLFWLHAWDFLTPVEEVMRGLDDLRRAGKILYAGISDTPAWIVAEANALARERRWTAFDAIQIRYRLIDRSPERELIPMAAQGGLSVLVWGALAEGILTGKYARPPREGEARRLQTSAGAQGLPETHARAAEAVGEIAKEIGATPAQVALAWVRSRGPAFIPILGARSDAQLRDNLGCLAIRLPEAALARLDDLTRIEPGFPHDFLARDTFKHALFGDMAGRIRPRGR
jgi:aryl-alcohol dehydrogenase-like predicted oxidoreductase